MEAAALSVTNENERKDEGMMTTVVEPLTVHSAVDIVFTILGTLSSSEAPAYMRYATTDVTLLLIQEKKPLLKHFKICWSSE